MKDGGEWRALATCGDVRRPKIAHHRDAQFGCQIRRFPDLERCSVSTRRIVKDRLAVDPDQVRLEPRSACVLRVEAAQIMVQLPHLVARCAIARGCNQPLLETQWKPRFP